jgi:hypothetical protein
MAKGKRDKKKGKSKTSIKKAKLNAKSDRTHTGVVRHVASKPEVSTPAETLGGYSRLDYETIKYFVEIKAHFDTVDEVEGRTLLVGLSGLCKVAYLDQHDTAG